MRQGTTPPYALTVEGWDLTDKTVFVTLEDQCHHQVTKTGEALTVAFSEGDSTIAFRMTQEETFRLKTGRIEVQVRFIDADGIANATNTVEIRNLKALLQKVIRYDGEVI